MAELGKKVRELRESRGWTQNELAKRSGIGRSYISLLETDNLIKPSADYLVKLAHTFSIRPEELYHAAGYITDTSVLIHALKETPEEILERLRIVHPVSVPVYTEFPFHAGGFTEPVEYVYRERTKDAGKNIEGYVVHGSCLEPIIQDGDIIIIDRQGEIDNGDIVACLVDDKLCLGRLRKIADDLILETKEGMMRLEEVQLAAPVIEVIRRLK